MTKFNLALIKMRIKYIAHWILIIGTGIAIGITLNLSGLFLASLKDSTLKSLRFQSPIQPIIRLEEKETFLPAPRKTQVSIKAVKASAQELTQALAQETILPKPLSLEDKICLKFKQDCKTAIAVAKAESGLKCSAQNVNKNGSVDLGLFQINSVHLKKGWKAVDLLDCDKAIELAHAIYLKQGFTPWVAYKNGSFKKYL